jgi:hypothetical protein
MIFAAVAPSISSIVSSIVFVDTEINPINKKILDIGAIQDNGAEFHSNSVAGIICLAMILNISKTQ